MVIISKMSENEMDNRGSKSEFTSNLNSVKEQREDGSLRVKSIMRLRCSLTGFERNYRANIPSKQFNIRKFTRQLTTGILSHKEVIGLETNFKHTLINPGVLTGLNDAEGSFSIILVRNKSRKLGWSFKAKFQIGLYIIDINLLR